MSSGTCLIRCMTVEVCTFQFLIYDGNFDIICNHPGILNMFEKMTVWSGIDEFNRSPSEPYIANDGKTAGYLKTAENLRMFVMRNAGHMVPRSQPVYGLEMFEKFINGRL